MTYSPYAKRGKESSRYVAVTEIEKRSFDDRIAQMTSAQPRFTRDNLSPDQVTVYDGILQWVDTQAAAGYLGAYPLGEKAPFLRVGGLAGTGKSTVTAAVAAELMDEFRIAFCAYTGKAANVLSRKLREAGINTSCTTIHSLIKIPVQDPLTGAITSWMTREVKDFRDSVDIIFVDEASMIDQSLWDDLRSFGCPIIAVGDHGQLPPVGNSTVNLMENPDLRLEKIHRQVEGNPIIELSQWIRAGKDIRAYRPQDNRVRFINSIRDIAHTVGKDHTVICFKNATRVEANKFIRKSLGFTKALPQKHELLILLKNAAPIYNGMRGRLESSDWEDLGHDPSADEINQYFDEWGCASASVAFDDDNLRAQGNINRFQFNQPKTFSAFTDLPKPPRNWGQVGLLFDYGYAMTCHKHQGAQARECTVIVSKWLGDSADSRTRWLYTAVTRAAEQLNIVFER